MFSTLRQHVVRPSLFSVYSAHTLWTDDHISSRMLEYHLDPSGDIASRNQAFIHRATSWLVREFDLVDRRVLDLGCGPGLYALELARSGADVTGVDFSKRSIDFAAKQARTEELRVDFEMADYLSYEANQSFDLICLIYGDYCALAPGQRSDLMRRAKRWLKPGGTIVLDVFSTNLLTGMVEATSFDAYPDGGFWSADPHFVFNTRFIYDDETAYLDRYLIVAEERKWEVFNWIQCFDPPRLEEDLASAGLRVDQCLGNLAGDSYDSASTEFAVVVQPGCE